MTRIDTIETLEALGMHPYEAERQTRGFVDNDKAQIRELAGLFNPDIPVHENAPYVERTREFIERAGEVMRGKGRAMQNRADRGWVPPTEKDVEAESS